VTELRRGGLGVYDLAGRVAVVAGGSGGIGAATVRRLADAGATVVLGYHSGEQRAARLIASLPGPGREAGPGREPGPSREPGPGHSALRISVDETPSITAAAETVRTRHGRCDILVNCAGWTAAVPHAALDALDDATIDRVLAVNVRGAFALVRAFAPLLRGSGDAAVVTVSSIAASTGSGSNIAYCGAKAAVDAMTLSLARVLAPQVRVLTVSPAAVDTGFVPGRDSAAVEKQAAGTPLRVVVHPDDVAVAIIGAITHLRTATGTVITIDGGRHL
jgi:3-oxoacyl-[acyl-carrier protein] reductase